MKKLWILCLVFLLLTGCADGQSHTGETTLPTETTIPLPSFYVEGSAVERGSGGKVRQFELDGTVTGMAMLEDALLLCVDYRTLYLLDSENLNVLRTRELEHDLRWDDESLVISDSGIAYYDEAQRTYTVLDSSLLITAAFHLNGELRSNPVITNDLSRIYYATEGGISVLHPGDGTSRRVREEYAPIVSVNGLLFGDEILCYTRQTEDGIREKCFVRIEDGSLLDASGMDFQLLDQAQSYVCLMNLRHAMGQSPRLVTGTRGGVQLQLDSQYRWDSALLPEAQLAVLQSVSSVGVTLYCYNLETGVLISSVIMPDQYEPLTMSCADNGMIWLCDGIGNRFFCWDTSIGELTGQLSEYVPYVTLGQQDADFTQFETRAQRMEEQHQITIEWVPGENRTGGADYTDYPDLRPDQYDEALAELQRALEILPENFLKKAGQTAASRRLTIRLVDDFDPMTGVSRNTGSMDVSDGQVVLYVSMCPSLKEIFYHELFHVLDVQILNKTDGMNHWEKLNPKGFAYVNTYATYESGALKDSPYLAWGENAFADDYSLISPREDRAQVFLYAVLEDQDFRFQSPVMQEKLELICKMLRKCFGVSGSPVWEQYLQD